MGEWLRRCRRLTVAVVVLPVLALAPAPIAQARQDEVPGEVPGDVADAPDVTAAGAVLWDPADDVVLAAKDETTPRRPASTTKILTVLLALEEAQTSDEVTVSQHAVDVAAAPGAATLNLTTGQRIQLRSLLAALMLRSGNDAAVAVAEHVAGSEDAFVQKMNARAADLGLADTAFINATGLTDDLAHHASPLDLAKLAEVALRDRRFAHWAAADTLDVAGIGVLENRNELLGTYEGATGVKTGYTAAAGLCLVASAERNGRTLIAVVLGSEDSFGDAAALLDHGFTAYRRPEPLRAGSVATRYRWAHASVRLTAAETLGRTVRAGSRARWRIKEEPDIAPPVDRGDELGVAELLVGGEVVDTTPLRAAADVAAPADDGAAGAGGAVQDALRAFARIPSVARTVTRS